MAQCKKCSKKGMFLKLDSNGMCSECNASELQKLQTELKQKSDTINNLQDEIQELQNMLTPEQKEFNNLRVEIQKLSSTKKELEEELTDLKNKAVNAANEISTSKLQLLQITDQIYFQDFSLYEPRYDFINSEQYKVRLDEIRKKQKELIKTDRAATGNNNWTVNNSASQGKKMVSDTKKLLIRAFNSECDELIDKVKHSNFDLSLKRINASCDAISKLGKLMQIEITREYRNSKVDELHLAFEYQTMKQKEKEEQKELRAQMREEAKLQREIEEARKKAQKEQKHYENAYQKLIKQIKENGTTPDLEEKLKEVEEQLGEIKKSIEQIDYREANQRAGYVYIISNIGSFGENIYKIGMTRRLDPTERVDELGDASVPFDFDIHAMIFSEDAPKLENSLHKAFDHKKLNLVNSRREFFNVTLEEIKEVVKANYDKTAEFINIAEAEQYRTSQSLRKH